MKRDGATGYPVLKFQPMRIEAGDYLTLSNDGKTLWRIHRYYEDGSLQLGDGEVVRGHFWSVWKYDRVIDGEWDMSMEIAADLEHWDMWSCWDTQLRTKRACLDFIASEEPKE